MQIRTYTKADYPMLKSWYEAFGEACPEQDNFLEDSTFFLVQEDKPVYSVTCYLTNCKTRFFLEHFIRAPEFKDKQASQGLIDFIECYARDLGYKYMIGFTIKPSLVKRYLEMGCTQTHDNVSTFIKKV